MTEAIVTTGRIEIDDLREGDLTEPHDGFVVEWTYRAGDYHVDFKLLDSLCGHEDEKDRQTFGTGSLKWDGCCNLSLDTSHCALHFCGPEQEPVLGKMMKAVYSLGPKMPAWDHGGGA